MEFHASLCAPIWDPGCAAEYLELVIGDQRSEELGLTAVRIVLSEDETFELYNLLESKLNLNDNPAKRQKD